MENSKKDPASKFSFAMDNLKDILDQEGIVKTASQDDSSTLFPSFSDSDTPPEFSLSDSLIDDSVLEEHVAHPPVLDGTITVIDDADPASVELDAYISDLEDNEFDYIDLAKTPTELEQKLAEMTEPDQINKIAHPPQPVTVSKEQIQRQLTLFIEQSVEQFKTQLISTLDAELEDLFSNAGN